MVSWAGPLLKKKQVYKNFLYGDKLMHGYDVQKALYQSSRIHGL